MSLLLVGTIHLFFRCILLAKVGTTFMGIETLLKIRIGPLLVWSGQIGAKIIQLLILF
jgi:ABC-type Co2+ transport system permease subunit